jgi:serine/threonine-protein kinase
MNIGALLENKYKIESLVDANILNGLYLATNIKSKKSVLINLLPHNSRTCIKNKFFDKFFIEYGNSSYGWEYTRAYPNIFITSFGEIPNGQAYLVLEFVDSSSLTEVIKQNTRLSAKQAIKVGLQVCESILRINSLGVIYRNINPDTIMVNLSNNLIETKPLDFDIDINKLYKPQQFNKLYSALGISLPIIDKKSNKLTNCPCGWAITPTIEWCLGCGRNIPHLLAKAPVGSQLDFTAGNLQFMTPEQAQGIGTFYPQADIYIVGILLYLMLSGDYPFNGKTSAMLLMQHITAQPQSLTNFPDISQELDNTVQRALAKNPSHRQKSFLELAKELAEIFPNAKSSIDPSVKIKSVAANFINNSSSQTKEWQPIKNQETGFFQSVVSFFSSLLGKK